MIGPIPTSTIIYAALKELNAVDSGAPGDASLMADGLELLNNIFDDWNGERGKVYADSFLSFTITPNLNPHTIGPTAATWTMTQRPVTIEGIQVVLSTGNPVPYVYLRPRDAAWWQRNPSPTVTANYPTDFYYDPTWTTAAPNGSVFMWPVPTTAYPVQVWTRILLAQLTMNQQISLPPGYNYALRMELAKRGAVAWRKQWTPQQEQLTLRAIAKLEANNSQNPRIMTADAGMPRTGSGSGLPDFMWPYGGLSGPR
jgi:hypothetical protein